MTLRNYRGHQADHEPAGSRDDFRGRGRLRFATGFGSVASRGSGLLSLRFALPRQAEVTAEHLAADADAVVGLVEVLRRFLPGYFDCQSALRSDQRRDIRAAACRTAAILGRWNISGIPATTGSTSQKRDRDSAPRRCRVWRARLFLCGAWCASGHRNASAHGPGPGRTGKTLPIPALPTELTAS